MTKEIDKKLQTKILVPYGAIRKMSSDLGVCVDTISDALSGKHNIRVVKMIRNIAVSVYGGAALQ